jgi:membrane peptidoglycan carboxypeptidase
VIPDSVYRYAPSPRQMLWGVLGASVLLAVLVAIAYATTSIPNPNDTATNQQTFYLFSNGKVMAHGGQTNRINVRLDQIPVDVRHAVLSAEDRNFESEPGISPTGILRAFLTDLRGGDIQQGGSTITQQYVKNAYLSQQRTFTRKIKEIFISLKLANSKPKDEILQDYLNTIYFGRNAYGIAAASVAYFGKSVTKLDATEGAVLAASIRAPSFYDPSTNRSAAVARWHYVIDGMVKQGWLPADQAAQAQYPTVIKPGQGASASNGDCVGPTGFICQAVKFDLLKHGFTEDRLAAGGYHVFTTIDQAAQKAAVAAESANNGGYQTTGPDKGRESALISVQPGDGAIRAMYGGDVFCPPKQRPDSCTDLTGLSNDFARSPGSSFKPYTLIAALQQGISLDSRFSGPPHIDFPGTNGKGISNSQNESCGQCTLTQALAKSINTIFVPLAAKVGPDKVAHVAADAGVDTKKHKLDPVPTITLGTSDVSPLDQAVGYATIAAQGIEAQPYLVSKVVTADGHVVYRAKRQTHRVFPADVMADTTYAMTQVLGPSGTAAGKGLPGRPAAGKTGTNGQVTGNFDAWFIGFTPQLSTAVWYGNTNRKHEVTSNGQALYGGGLPASTWQQMMTGAMAGKPVENFPPPAHVGHAINPSPTATASATTSPTATASATTVPITPTPSIKPTHSLPPVISPSPSPTPTSSPSGGGGGGGGNSPSPPAGGG